MRADRLLATLLLLQARTRVTAAEVAAELEVSERTARRDLEALSAAGVPVYAQPGRGGGWQLVGGARTDLTGLTADEARALFLVAGPAAAATPELRAALRKLVRALPEPFRATAERAAVSVVVDPGGWGRSVVPRQPPYLEALQAAVTAGEQLVLGYGDRTGRSSSRVVHPLGLVMKGTVWYLVAGTDAGLRTFRVWRVTSVEHTGERAVRPSGFDLQAEWRRIAANVDELRAPERVDLLVTPDVLPMLRWLFDRQLRVGDDSPGDGGRVRVEVGGPSIAMLAVQLAGFGGRIEVTGPPAVRDRLAALGRELVDLYGPTTAAAR